MAKRLQTVLVAAALGLPLLVSCSEASTPAGPSAGVSVDALEGEAAVPGSRKSYDEAPTAAAKVQAAIRSLDELSSFQVKSTLTDTKTGAVQESDISLSKSPQGHYTRANNDLGLSELLILDGKGFQRGAQLAQSMGEPEFWDMPAGMDFMSTWIPVPDEDPLTDMAVSNPLFMFMLYRDSYSSVAQDSVTEIDGRKLTVFHAKVDSGRLLAEMQRTMPRIVEGTSVDEISKAYPQAVDIFIDENGLVERAEGTTENPLGPGSTVNVFHGFDSPVSYPEPEPMYDPWTK
ncbi:hypothetical protein [Mycolicibacterium sp. A43C]